MLLLLLLAFALGLSAEEISSYIELGKTDLIDVYENEEEITQQAFSWKLENNKDDLRSSLSYRNSKKKYKDNVSLSNREDTIRIGLSRKWGKSEYLRINTSLLLRNKDRVESDFQEYNFGADLAYSRKKTWEAGAGVREQFYDFWTNDAEQQYLRWHWKGWFLDEKLTARFAQKLGRLHRFRTITRGVTENDFRLRYDTGGSIIKNISLGAETGKRSTLDVPERDDDEFYGTLTYFFDSKTALLGRDLLLNLWTTEKDYTRLLYYDHEGRGGTVTIPVIKSGKKSLRVSILQKKMIFSDIPSLSYFKKGGLLETRAGKTELEFRIADYNFFSERSKDYRAYEAGVTREYKLYGPLGLEIDFTWRYKDYISGTKKTLFISRLSVSTKI